ncbi:TPA: type 1 fimbrial protein [Citrobacter werkmanii]|nr:type 1 fimbrial protein [Citrobacter werkmanii]
MKKTNIFIFITFIIFIIALVPLSSVAKTVSATMDVEFLLTNPTCDVDVESSDRVVNFGVRKKSEFQGVNSGVGEKTFKITLKNCSNTNSVGLEFSGAADEDNLSLFKNTIPKDRSGSDGVAIKIMASNGELINASGGNAYFTTVNSLGGASLQYVASLVQTKPNIVAGLASASVRYKVSYN